MAISGGLFSGFPRLIRKGPLLDPDLGHFRGARPLLALLDPDLALRPRETAGAGEGCRGGRGWSRRGEAEGSSGGGTQGSRSILFPPLFGEGNDSSGRME